MDRLVSYENNPQWQLINHTYVTFYQICPAVMLAILNIWSIKIIDLNPSNARGLEVMSAKQWRRDLTWLRVRVPSRRLAETWGHEHIVLGNCKGAKMCIAFSIPINVYTTSMRTEGNQWTATSTSDLTWMWGWKWWGSFPFDWRAIGSFFFIWI